MHTVMLRRTRRAQLSAMQARDCARACRSRRLPAPLPRGAAAGAGLLLPSRLYTEM